MANVKQIINLLNRIAPFDMAEPWDNSGLQAGNTDWEVSRIIIALDATMPLMQEAVRTGSDLVITHHPLLMSAEKTFDFSIMPGAAIAVCAKHNISLVSAHTNLDKAEAGLNDYFVNRIGISDILGPLLFDDATQDNANGTGIGRLARLESKTTLEEFGRQIKSKLELEYLRITGDMTSAVETIAVCTGSGGSLIPDFINSGADVYVTGDIKYHEARKIEELSKGLIDVGHFGSEQIAVDLLSDRLTAALKQAGLNIELISFKNEKDPFTIV